MGNDSEFVNYITAKSVNVCLSIWTQNFSVLKMSVHDIGLDNKNRKLVHCPNNTVTMTLSKSPNKWGVKPPFISTKTRQKTYKKSINYDLCKMKRFVSIEL